MKKNTILTILACITLIYSLSAQKRDSIVYPDTAFYMDQIYRIHDGQKTHWGFYENNSKKIITEPQYDSIIHRYRSGLNLEYYEILDKGKWGLLKQDRTVWVPAVYDKLDYEHTLVPHRIFVQKSDKYGILNKDGSTWLEPVYEEIQSNGYEFKVKKNGKWGILTNEGKEFIPVCFDKIFEHPMPQLSLVQNGNDFWTIYQWVQQSANPCAPESKFQFERIEYFNEFFTVLKNGKWGLADIKGDLVLKMDYEELKPFVFSYLRTLKVKQNGKFGLIRVDSLGQTKVMADIKYDEIGVDEDSYKLKVALGTKKDYLYDGKPYFDLVYEDVFYFLDYRVFSIKKGKKWGLAREDKTIFIQPKYDKIMFLDAKTYMVQKGEKWGIINEQDKVLIPAEFTEFDYRPEAGYFFAAKGAKWGVVSLKQGVVLPAKYDDLMILPNKAFLVNDKGLIGVVGPGGKVIVPIEYADMSYKPGDSIVLLKHADGRQYKYRIK
jgi:hypothetical protein